MGFGWNDLLFAQNVNATCFLMAFSAFVAIVPFRSLACESYHAFWRAFRKQKPCTTFQGNPAHSAPMSLWRSNIIRHLAVTLASQSVARDQRGYQFVGRPITIRERFHSPSRELEYAY